MVTARRRGREESLGGIGEEEAEDEDAGRVARILMMAGRTPAWKMYSEWSGLLVLRIGRLSRRSMIDGCSEKCGL